MMRLVKHRPDDKELIHDEDADVVDRSCAFFRLVSDGYRELMPVAREWLAHDQGELRVRAVRTLIAYWGSEDDLDVALHLLEHDPDWDVRSTAAGALADFASWHGGSRDRIVRALVRQLESDPEVVMQYACYEALLGLLAPDRLPLSNGFEPDRDVDWSLLAPYRDADLDPPGPPGAG